VLVVFVALVALTAPDGGAVEPATSAPGWAFFPEGATELSSVTCVLKALPGAGAEGVVATRLTVERAGTSVRVVEQRRHRDFRPSDGVPPCRGKRLPSTSEAASWADAGSRSWSAGTLGQAAHGTSGDLALRCARATLLTWGPDLFFEPHGDVACGGDGELKPMGRAPKKLDVLVCSREPLTAPIDDEPRTDAVVLSSEPIEVVSLVQDCLPGGVALRRKR
jgi:hypothetical protein